VAIIAAGWATGVVFCISLLATIVLAIKREWRQAVGKISAVVAGFGVFIFCVGYVALPKVPVHVNKLRLYHAEKRLEELGKFVSTCWEQSPPTSLAEARKATTQEPKLITDNILLGGKIREEDSPGNYLIRQTTSGFQFFWFDRDGGEHALGKP
jgi:hypothetical protein